MRLLRSIEVRNFRSLRSVDLVDLDAYVPVVGLNGSGKSNLLRALSLFFTGEVEPGMAVSLKRDHFDPGRRLGGRRRISVRLTFDLSHGYSPRPQVEGFFERLGVTDQIVVERAWYYTDPSALATSEEVLAAAAGEPAVLSDDDATAAGTFIRSVRLRYVPNHIRPAELLADEIQTLRRAINRRVRSRAAFRSGGVQDALDDLGAVTKEMLTAVSERVVEHTPELAAIVPEIPNDFADLAFQLGLATVSASGVTQPPDLQGSGTQSYLLLHVLDLIDRSAFEVDFGWTKAVVWAIEEPESFLHAGLRTRVAGDLHGFAQDPRRQVFVTTHEPEFQRVAGDVWIAQLAGAATSFEIEPARTAIVTSSRLRIASFQHPLFLSPDRPLVLAEGSTDVEYLRLAAESLGLKPLWSILSLGDLEASKTGGSDVESYLRANPSVLASRPLHAPVIVLRDWEDNDRTVGKYNDALAPHNTSRCIRPPDSLCNPHLSQKFRGIERFLPTEVVEEVLGGAVRPKSLSVRYPLYVEKEDLEAHKHALLNRVSDTGSPGPYLCGLAEWLDDQVRDAIGQAPTRQMLLPF